MKLLTITESIKKDALNNEYDASIPELVAPEQPQKTTGDQLSNYFDSRSYWDKFLKVRGEEITDKFNSDQVEYLSLGYAMDDLEEFGETSDDGENQVWLYTHTPSGRNIIVMDNQVFWIK